jgi:hypothetical protein
MNKYLKVLIVLSFVAFLIQSCEKEIETTHMEDYLSAGEFTPDWTDNFETMDRWERLENDGEDQGLASVWTPSEKGLNVVARSGWNHRAMWEQVPDNFTVEFKIKMGEVEGEFPKAGIIIGELGGDAPKMILGLDNHNNTSTIVKFIQFRPDSEWANLSVPELNVHKWQVLRLKKEGENIYIYLNGIRVYYEKGGYIANIHGRLGLFVESSVCDYEFISYKAD